eukprot:GDKI01006999.1.p1 GENE.GDKI01006999.1~~GDKI01006999.1.p1  ORF type:complete len:225 (+),score=45.00 GDKI01006999.1:148-822(+)
MLLMMFAAFFNLLGAGCMIAATVLRSWLHANSAMGITADFGLWDFCIKVHPTLAALVKLGGPLAAFLMANSDGCYEYGNVPGIVYSAMFSTEEQLMGLRTLVISSALIAVLAAAAAYMAVGFQYTKNGLYVVPAAGLLAGVCAIASVFLARNFWWDTVSVMEKLVGREYYSWYTSYMLMCIGAACCLLASYISFVQVRRVTQHPHRLPFLNKPAGRNNKRKTFW